MTLSQGRPVDVALLRRFAPLDGMKKENQAALARKVFIKEMDSGRLLFKQGDQDKRVIWVVSGTVELREDDRTMGVIRGGTPEARNPLTTKATREFSARAMDQVEYLSIDSELLDVMITWDQTGTYEVAELQTNFPNPEADDWMTTLLQSRAMRRIPPANIQAIFMRMQRVPHRAGDVVIHQGAEGDYFYCIVSGRCVVTRETPLNKDGIKLAELGVGDTFGEEALISEAKRNATVTMLTDGVLMRLAKAGFPRADDRAAAALGHALGGRGDGDHQGRGVAGRAPALGIPEPGRRRRGQRAAVLHPPEALDAGQEQALHRVLRHGAAQLGRGVHPGGAWLRCLRAEGRPVVDGSRPDGARRV